MVCIEDIISEVVSEVNKELEGKNPVVYFKFGTLRGMVEHLDKLAQDNRVDNYPLIALIEPFKQEREIAGVDCRIKLRFLISTYTQQNLSAAERLELNFKPVLFPVYDALLKQLKRSEYFRTDVIKHTVINHFEIGKESLSGYEGSVFNDHIDSVEIQDMELSVKSRQCKIKNF